MHPSFARSAHRGGAFASGLAALAALAGCAVSGHSVSVVAKPSTVRTAEARLAPDGRVTGRVCRSVEVAAPRAYDIGIVVRDASGQVLAHSQTSAQGFADRPHRPNCGGFSTTINAPAAQAATVELTVRDLRPS